MNTKHILRLARWLAAAIAVLTLAACSGAAPANDAATPAPLVINVKAADIMFDPMTLSAKVGQPVTVNFQNAGALEHSFIIDKLNVKLEHVQAGQTATVTFTPTAAGAYEFYCNVAGHKDAGRKGTLTVSS